MTRIDTLRAISALCRGSHAKSLLAVGWLTVEMPLEPLEELLEALHAAKQPSELVDHIDLFKRLHQERYGSSSRLD